MAGVPPFAFKHLLETGEHSDFTTVRPRLRPISLDSGLFINLLFQLTDSQACGSTEFKVHKAIITLASDYFKIMCRDGFKVSRFCFHTAVMGSASRRSVRDAHTLRRAPGWHCSFCEPDLQAVTVA